MPRGRLLWCAVAGAMVALPSGASGQVVRASAYVPLDDVAYQYIDALTVRGALSTLSSLERPYTVAAIARALRDSTTYSGSRVLSSYAAGVARAVAKYAFDDDSATFEGFVTGSLFMTAQRSARRELMLGDDSAQVAPGATASLFMGTQTFVGVGRILGDNRLKYDPDFVGKKNRIIAGRMEDAYLSGQWKYGEVFLGRIGRNWGPPMLDGLLLGHSAYTYDQLYGTVGNDRLHLTTLVARLDDFRFYSLTATPPGSRVDSVAERYFGIHRLGSRVRNVEFAVTEAMVYGGVGRGFEPAYGNPFNWFDLAAYNEGRSGNVSYGIDVAWRSPRLGQWYAQGQLDDYQVDRCGAPCLKPPSYGWTVAAEGLPLVGEQRAFGSFTRVTNLTYRNTDAFERYSYENVGLARAYSDYDELRVGVDLAAVPAVPLRLYLAHRRQGEGDYREPYPTIPEYPATVTFLSGVVERVTRYGVTGAGRFGDVEITGDAGYNVSQNHQHVVGWRRAAAEARVRVAFAPRWRWALAGRAPSDLAAGGPVSN